MKTLRLVTPRPSILVSAVLVIPLFMYGCGKEPTAPDVPASTGTEVSFAKGGKPKPPTLPGDCAVGQTVVWNSSAFVCADPSITGWEIVQVSVTTDAFTFGRAACPTGKVVLGGGIKAEVTNSGPLNDTGPVQIGPNQWGWEARYSNVVPSTVYAICADGSS